MRNSFRKNISESESGLDCISSDMVRKSLQEVVKVWINIVEAQIWKSLYTADSGSDISETRDQPHTFEHHIKSGCNVDALSDLSIVFGILDI